MVAIAGARSSSRLVAVGTLAARSGRTTGTRPGDRLAQPPWTGRGTAQPAAVSPACPGRFCGGGDPARRRGPHQPTFGRGAVEHMLVAATGLLRRVTGPSDLIGRSSDSQMVVVRPNQPSAGAEDAARRIVDELSAPIDLVEGVPLRLDPRAGVAVAHQHGHDLADLVPRAETALFDAVARQSTARVYAPETRLEVDARLTLLRRLSRCLNDPARASEIAMLFQPQVSVRTGCVDAGRGLAAVDRSRPRVGATDELIEAVEPTGVMQQLTLHVLDRVAGQLAEWNQRDPAARRSERKRFQSDRRGIRFSGQGRARTSPDNPQQLDIEVTERTIIEDSVVLDEAAHRIANLGVGLSSTTSVQVSLRCVACVSCRSPK